MKCSFLMSICMLSCSLAMGQVVSSSGFLGSYSPPSPEASSLGKYIDNPVGFYTGTPIIDVPLFDLVCGRIKVPISISYHASGVKVDEIASRVGTGFSLNAGGVVSTIVKGMIDGAPVLGYLSPDNPYTNNSSGPVDPNLAVMAQYDLEPDAHYYHFGSKQGKIYFKDRNTPFTINNDPIQIVGPYNGDKKFIITTEDGIIYKFEAAEGIRQITYTPGSLGIISTSFSYYLTEIEDPIYNKRVKFIYRNDMPEVIQYANKRFYNTSMLECDFVQPPPTDNQTAILQAKVLQKIEYTGGFIEFKTDHNRQDLIGDRAYTEINQYVHELQIGSPLLKKGFNLSYSYTSSGGTMEGKRLYLETIQEKGADGTFLPAYTFSYKNRESLPARNSLQQDVWGFYNANGAANFAFPKIYVYNNEGKCSYLPIKVEGWSASNIVAGLDRSSNPSTIDYGVLNKITYPTRGYITYDYEPHAFGYEVNTMHGTSYASFKQGGIRIKEIKSFSSNGELLLNKSYSYFLGHLGGALPQAAVPTSSQYPYFRFANNQSLLGSTQGSYVGYGGVIESVKDQSNKISATIYHYSTDADVEGSFGIQLKACIDFNNLNEIRRDTFFPFFEMESREARRGVLLKEEFFNNFLGVQEEQPMKKIEYSYNLWSNFVIGITSVYVAASEGIKFMGGRNLNQEKMLLTSKIETEYTTTGDPIIHKTNYSYTDNKQFVRTRTVYSTNDEPHDPMLPSAEEKGIQTTYKYPFDYSSSASAGAMGKMVNKNYINIPINEVTKTIMPNGQPSYFIGSKITNYKDLPPFGPFPSEVFHLKSAIAENSGNLPLVYPADPANPGTKYEKRSEYKYNYNTNPSGVNHDNNGTVLSWSAHDSDMLLSKSETQSLNLYAETFSLPPQSWNPVYDPDAMTGTTSFEWSGYNSSFPLLMNGWTPTIISFWAKGGSFSLEAIGGDYLLINEVAPANWKYYSYTIPASQDWREAEVYLRGTAKLDEVLMANDDGLRTTYGYDAYQRLKYIIDPSGKIETYEYDPFSRLKYVKDQDGNIIKSYDYHYKP